LEEIQCIIDEKQNKMQGNEDDDNSSEGHSITRIKIKISDEIGNINTDNMLNEVKYNIVVATLVKNRHERMVRMDEGMRKNYK
jgi:hypothetical protein